MKTFQVEQRASGPARSARQQIADLSIGNVDTMNKQKPSRTAYKVALNILALGAKPEMAGVLPPGIVEATAQLLIASGAASARTVGRYRSARMARVYDAFDWMMPGQFEAFAERKAFCERQVRQGIAAGASQVLVLGAGYDTLGWRLAPELPQVAFFEIEHPATAARKRRGIEEMGPRPNLHLVAADLGQRRLIDVLASDSDWDQRAPTTIVAEGLLQYLEPQAVRDLFRQCASFANGSRIAFTYSPTGDDGRPNAGPLTGLVLWLLRVGGEPWLWSIRPDELAPFLKTVGWANAPELESATGKHGAEFYAVALKSESSQTKHGAEGGTLERAPQYEIRAARSLPRPLGEGWGEGTIRGGATFHHSG